MQIITIDDGDFTDLLHALREGTLVGRYWRDGKVQVVCATERFMLVSPEHEPLKIALKPARNKREAEDLCKRLLKREEQRGNQVEHVVQ